MKSKNCWLNCHSSDCGSSNIIGVSINSVSDVEKLKALLESEMGAKK